MKKIKIPFKHKKREITFILLILIVLGLFLSGYSMGKEYSKTNIEAKAKIAEPILIVENNPVIEVNGKKEKEYYEFKVKNYRENGEITQIDLTYYVEILTKEQESISFKLYKNEEEIPLENNQTQTMQLASKIRQQDNYRLEILYDRTKDQSQKEILQDIQIKVHSEQAKG